MSSKTCLRRLFFMVGGLGLGGQVNSITVIGIWLSLSILQLVIAFAWLQQFQMGPMEWIRKKALQAMTQ